MEEKDAYKQLGISRRWVEQMKQAGISPDLKLKQRVNEIIALIDRASRSEQEKEVRKKQVLEAYENIKDDKARQAYESNIKELPKESHKTDELQENYEAKPLQENYETTPIQVNNLKYKKVPNPNNNLFVRDNGENIVIRRIGEIDYVQGVNIEDFINEYEIIRMLQGKRTSDIIYGNIQLSKMTSSRKEDEEYQKYVINQLLSEENIQSSVMYRNGYIGEVAKEKSGILIQEFLPYEQLAIKKFAQIKGKKPQDPEDNLKHKGEER